MLQVYLDQWTLPDTCICSTSAQKAELKVVGVFGGETGVSVLVCRWGAAFEMDWWSFGVFQQILKQYTHFSPCLHVLTWYPPRN